jgi:hypothetical protein
MFDRNFRLSYSTPKVESIGGVVWNSFSVQRWEKQRKAGIRKFIITRGVLGWGCLTAFMVSMLSWATNSSTWTVGHVIWNFLTYPIAGIFFGWWLWNYSEKKYTKQVGKIRSLGKKNW